MRDRQVRATDPVTCADQDEATMTGLAANGDNRVFVLCMAFYGQGHAAKTVMVSGDGGKTFRYDAVPGSLGLAGDLVENGAPPYFGDGYPLDWPATLERMVELVTGAVVPGHGDVGDKAFAVRTLVEIRQVAELAEMVHVGQLDIGDAVVRTPYPADAAREPLERALAQLRGELDRAGSARPTPG